MGAFGSTKPYIHVPVNTSSIGSDQKIYCVIFTGILKSGSASGMALANLGGIDVSWATPEPSGTELYINGIRYSGSTTYNKNAWNLYAIRFTSGVSVPADLKIGLNSSSNWIADNISVFTKNITATDIGNIYKEYFGTVPVQVVDSHPEPFVGTVSEDPGNPFKSSILALDSELSNGQTTFQPLVGQSGFHAFSLCPRLASTSDSGNWVLTGTSPNFVYTFGSNRDNQKVDNIEPDLNDLILLKNQTTLSQNGIYLVSAKTSTSLSLTKQTNPTNNHLVFVKNGFINKNYYFIKTSSNTYINSVVQRKIGHYDKIGFQVMRTFTVS